MNKEAFLLKLDEIRNLPEDWDSYGGKAPSKETCDRAIDLYEKMMKLDLELDRITQTADEGIIMTFRTKLYGFPQYQIEFEAGGEDIGVVITDIRGFKDFGDFEKYLIDKRAK